MSNNTKLKPIPIDSQLCPYCHKPIKDHKSAGGVFNMVIKICPKADIKSAVLVSGNESVTIRGIL